MGTGKRMAFYITWPVGQTDEKGTHMSEHEPINPNPFSLASYIRGGLQTPPFPSITLKHA